MRDEFTADLTRRGKSALLLGGAVLLLSTLLYYAGGCVVGMNARYGKSFFDLSDDRWELSECFYAAAITVTTVGYTDLVGSELCEVWVDDSGRHRWESATDAHQNPGYDVLTERLETDYSAFTRSLTAIQVIVAMGFFLYVIAQATSFFVEDGHGELVWRLRTRRRLAGLADHVVICGAGELGQQAVEHLREVGVDCVVVDENLDALRAFRTVHPNVPCVHGDAIEEEALQEARVEQARALLSLLPDGRLNLVNVVTARHLNAQLRIACRGGHLVPSKRLKAGGADTVLALDALIGMRAASELIRPSVVWFLDRLASDAEPDLRGIVVGAAASGKTLAELGLATNQGCAVVAVRSDRFLYNPPPTTRVHEGDEVAILAGRALLESASARIHAGASEHEVAADVHARDDSPVLHPECDSPGHRTEHYIVCGSGAVGGPIIEEMRASGRRLVVIELDEARVAALREQHADLDVVHGSAQDFETLERADVMTSRGLVTALPTDRDNLVVAVTARVGNPDLRVVAVAREERAARRLGHAGAHVVPASRLGGRRMASEVLHPAVTTFLDEMRDSGGATRFEAVIVQTRAPWCGRALCEVDLTGETGLQIVATLDAPSGRITVSPGPSTRLEAGTVLLVVGSAERVERLAGLVGDWE